MQKFNDFQRNGFTLAAACGLIGITYGVFADTAGLSLLQASALSIFTFTGASQFAAVSVIDGGGNPAAAVGSALLLSVRNALYGPVIAKSLHNGKLYKVLAAHFVNDETIAVASSQDAVEDSRDAFWFTGLSLFVFWNLGTILGVLLGGIIEDPGSWGLDAAFPAAFVALTLPHVTTREGKITAIIAAVITIVSIPLTPVGMPILLASTAILPGLLALKKKKKRTT